MVKSDTVGFGSNWGQKKGWGGGGGGGGTVKITSAPGPDHLILN